jgi:hypothetical protein
VWPLNIVSQIDDLIQQARRAGFEIRYEYLGGRGGGVCEFGGKRWLFVDLALSTEESWEVLRQALSDAADQNFSARDEQVALSHQSGSARNVA